MYIKLQRWQKQINYEFNKVTKLIICKKDLKIVFVTEIHWKLIK